MSVSQNFPTVRPTLNLNFARSKTLDPRITFTRSSTATYIDSDGLVKTAGVYQARFDHNPITGESLGLLIEESRSNLIEYSTISTVAGWSISGSTVTDNATTAPDGTNTAARIQVTGFYVAVLSIPVTAGQTYTFSFWVKSVSGSGTWGINIYDHGGANIGHHRTTVNVTEEWSRVEYSYTPTGTQINFYISDDRSNLATISDAYVWGAQLEVGSFPTSYIPTSGSAVTRSADTAQITGTNFSSWYNPTEGTLYASASILGKNIHTTGVEYPNGICKLSDTGSNLSYSRVLYFGGNADPDRVSFGNRDSSSSITPRDDTFGDIQSNQYYKVCGAYINNDEQAMCLNGRDIEFNGTNVNPPTPNQFLIGTGYNGGIAQAPGQNEMYLNGHISQLMYYPERLTNSQLQNLTK